MHYLSVCAIYRDEAAYLREWVEFHRLVGVERFYLYDNRSNDDHRDVLAPYTASGVASIDDWPLFPGQVQAYDHCLAKRRDESRWIAFLDLDEFLFSPTGKPVSELLTEYERWPAVGANWVTFGTSGHSTPPAGLVIENYVRSKTDPRWRSRFIKSVVDPRRTARCISPHHFSYDEGFAVDESFAPICKQPFNMTESFSASRLRVNHYTTRSQQEWERKAAAPTPHTGTERFWDRFIGRPDVFNDDLDETITAYVPALKRALDRDVASAEGA